MQITYLWGAVGSLSAQGPTWYIGSRALIKEINMQTAYETQAPVLTTAATVRTATSW